MRDYSPLRERAAKSETVLLKSSTVEELLNELDALRAAATPKMKRNDYPALFEEAWQAYPSRPGANKRATFRAWSARIKAGTSAGSMLAGACAYANYIQATGQHLKLPETFFGPDEHFAADWTPPEVQKKPGGGNWWATDATILAKGAELGLSPRSGEYMGQFKARIELALDPALKQAAAPPVFTTIMPTVAAPHQPERRTPKPEGIGTLKDLVRRDLPSARAA